MHSTPHFLAVSAVIVLCACFFLGGAMMASGVIIGVRFLYYFVAEEGTGKVQSLILAAILTTVRFQACLLGQQRT